MSMSLRQFRYFLAAAEKGQVGLAAASLNVSQSTVTAALQQLEREVGVSLFRRLPTGVELTAEGSRFLNHARNVIAAVTVAATAGAPLSAVCAERSLEARNSGPPERSDHMVGEVHNESANPWSDST